MNSLQSANRISELIYRNYSDVINKKKVPEKQILHLINKIIAFRKTSKPNKSESPKNVNVNPINTMEVFPRHISPEKQALHHINISSEEKEKNLNVYSKSNQNFFNSNAKNSNINFIDEQNFEEKDLKSELEQINNNRKSRYLDEEKEDNNSGNFRNAMSSSHDNFISIKEDQEISKPNRMDRYKD